MRESRRMRRSNGSCPFWFRSWKISRPAVWTTVKRAINTLCLHTLFFYHHILNSALLCFHAFFLTTVSLAVHGLLFQLRFSCSAGSSSGNLVMLRSGIGYHLPPCIKLRGGEVCVPFVRWYCKWSHSSLLYEDVITLEARVGSDVTLRDMWSLLGLIVPHRVRGNKKRVELIVSC